MLHFNENSQQFQNDLEMMKELLPCEYFKANHIWKPVYEEYKRVGYRIKKEIY